MADLIDRQAAIDAVVKESEADGAYGYMDAKSIIDLLYDLPSAEPKKGKWILNRSGAYCCSKCMEPCATYVMMKPRDRFCKMCGADMRKESI